MFREISPLIARAVLDSSREKNNWHNWQTCKKSTTCKVFTILVFICGCLFWIWLITTMIRYICLGFPARESFLCFTKKPVPQQNQQPFQPYHPNMNQPSAYPGSPYQPAHPYYPAQPASPPGYDRNLDPFQAERGGSMQEPSYAMHNMENRAQETGTDPTVHSVQERNDVTPVDLGGQNPRKF